MGWLKGLAENPTFRNRLNEPKAPESGRIASLDWIRVFSCICVTIVHFNASVSGWNAGVFVYPNSVIPNFYLGGRVNLGDIGVSLFFMLSGATLMYTFNSNHLALYYRKRFWNLYPMFWIAYIAATMIDFMIYKGMSPGNPLLMVFSFLGLDGYLCNLGLLSFDFYKLGEWFLGCILILYLIFPLLHKAFTKSQVLTCAVALLVYAVFINKVEVLPWKVNRLEFFLRIPELLLGMLFIQHRLDKRPLPLLAIGTSALLIAYLIKDWINPLTLTISLCVFLGSLLVCAANLVTNSTVNRIIRKISALTYPIFLVHHWLISKMVVGFPLESLPKRSKWMLFLIYIVLTLCAAEGLKRLGDYVVRAFRGKAKA